MTKTAPMAVVSFRLPSNLVRRLDAHAARLRREQRGIRFTRGDVVRLLLETGLDATEGGRHGKA